MHLIISRSLFIDTIDREPGQVNLAGKETNFHVHGYIDCTVLYNEWVVWHVLCGGCGQGEAMKWSKKWASLAGKETLQNPHQKMRHRPKIHEWTMPDILSGGACPPEAPKGGPKIGYIALLHYSWKVNL